MKEISKYINESIFDIDDETIVNKRGVQPQTPKELQQIIKNTIKQNNYKTGDCVDLSFIDTSKLKSFFEIFDDVYYSYDFDVTGWDVSHIEDMTNLFMGCKYFTGKGVENWDVSNVRDMQYMFSNCKNFNADLSKWRPIKCENFESMFERCEKFEGRGLDNWELSTHSMISFQDMFYDCTSLKAYPKWHPLYGGTLPKKKLAHNI